jgi:hypothetical protein
MDVFALSLNEEQLSLGIIIDKKEPRGLDKLEAFLFSKGLSSHEMIEFLRNLQSLRSSSVAHRNGKNYEKKRKDFLASMKKTWGPYLMRF